MPDNIIIDDYHGKEVHIHYDPNKHYLSEKINITDLYEVFEKVMNHLENNKGLNINKLIGGVEKMRITFKKVLKGKDFIKEMEEKHGSIENLKKKIEKTNNALYRVDLHTWECFIEEPEGTIEKTHTKLSNEINTLNLDFDLLETIRKEHPKSLKELAKLTNENMEVIQPKIDHLTKTGLIEFKKNIIPVLNYDEINIAI